MLERSSISGRKMPLSLAALTPATRISVVSSSNSRQFWSSMTSVFEVFAPVIPSL